MAGFQCDMYAVAAGAGAAWIVAGEANPATASGRNTWAAAPSHAGVMTSSSSSVAVSDEQSSSSIASVLSVLSPADRGRCVTATQQ